MSLSGAIDADVMLDERMARRTSYRIGGPAALYVVVNTYPALKSLLEVLDREQVAWVVLGRGSNVLVSDEGYRGVVLAVGDGITDLTVEGENLVCEAGVTLADAAEMACAEPELFRAVVSGSGFYQMSAKEILRVLPIQFYWANSEDDKGIFEQGMPTGRRVARFCKNSRYVQYKTRHHFYVELKDKSGRKNKDGSDEIFMDWLCSVVNK